MLRLGYVKRYIGYLISSRLRRKCNGPCESLRSLISPLGTNKTFDASMTVWDRKMLVIHTLDPKLSAKTRSSLVGSGS
ncbi:hypothetical protein J6590_068649 [Homalodisca vitripennis]|nr:hypothetical protein J6590_068649 [Homalodisca vitripennis]